MFSEFVGKDVKGWNRVSGRWCREPKKQPLTTSQRSSGGESRGCGGGETKGGNITNQNSFVAKANAVHSCKSVHLLS